MSECFPKPKSLGANMKVELDLSNYAIKADLKNASTVDTSKFAKKVDLARLKSNINKLDIDKLKNVLTNLRNLKSKVDKLDEDNLVPVTVDLSKPSELLKNDVVKKDVYNAKIKNIEDKITDITNLATNTSLTSEIKEVKNKIPSITNLAATAVLNAKINEVKNKIPNISNLLTTTALTAVENKISDHSKYITTPEFKKLTAKNFTPRLAQENLASKIDIADLAKKDRFYDKLKNSNKIVT